MGHGEGSAAADLLAKLGNDAARAAEHVSEANYDKARPAGALQRLADQLGQALGCAHHVGRVPRLVGGHQHEFLHAVVARRARQLQRPEDVVLRGLPGIVDLHERHVLVGGRVDHHRRPEPGENRLYPARIAYIADDRCYGRGFLCGCEFLLHAVQGVLVQLEQDQARRLESRDLAGELGSDRAASTGDHDHLARK